MLNKEIVINLIGYNKKLILNKSDFEKIRKIKIQNKLDKWSFNSIL